MRRPSFGAILGGVATVLGLASLVLPATAAEDPLVTAARRNRERKARLRQPAAVLDNEALATDVGPGDVSVMHSTLRDRRTDELAAPSSTEREPVADADLEVPSVPLQPPIRPEPESAGAIAEAEQREAEHRAADQRLAALLAAELYDPTADPAFWRERMAAAALQIQDLVEELGFARKRLLLLRLGLIVPVDALREQQRRPEIDGAMQRLADLERELEAAREQPARIREEGRRARADAGWFR